MTVRIVAFARVRELLGAPERTLELARGATIEDAWARLVATCPALEPLRSSTRFARNGALVSADDGVCDGDELALLPPFGGG